MVSSGASTVDDYLKELPSERRDVVAAVREEIRRNLPPGYVESMNWGMIAYEVPLERYPDTYNRQPLAYAALAAQKNYYAVYLNCAYLRPDGEARVQEEFDRAGKKLDMGKSCVRFRNLEDLPLPVIGKLISETPVDDFIQLYEAGRRK
jgi:hypothetical protein